MYSQYTKKWLGFFRKEVQRKRHLAPYTRPQKSHRSFRAHPLLHKQYGSGPQQDGAEVLTWLGFTHSTDCCRNDAMASSKT
ncbi:hypothetical protein MHYP_G00029000 [Metynnis hypsauchen]